MQKILLIQLLMPVFIPAWLACNKSTPANSALPAYVISIKTATVSNEYVSVYYIDSVNHQKNTVKIRPFILDPDKGDNYADLLPTGNFTSKYLFDACKRGYRNFKLQFSKGTHTETHDLFINFKYLKPPPGGFKISEAKVDGKTLPNMPASDSLKYGHYNTGFIYTR